MSSRRKKLTKAALGGCPRLEDARESFGQIVEFLGGNMVSVLLPDGVEVRAAPPFHRPRLTLRVRRLPVACPRASAIPCLCARAALSSWRASRRR
jgi:hypothetical protein